MDTVWVFNGDGGTFPAAIFSAREKADAWIGRHKLSGTLTRYPIDQAVYDWAVVRGHFKPRRPDQSGAEFIQRFSSASQEHYHYDAGEESA